MKKLVATLLIVATLTPTFALAREFDEAPTPTSVPRPGTGTTIDTLAGTDVNASARIAALANSGQVVGCETGGFGGALAQTFGAALQQAIPGFIRGQLQGALSKLAQNAGPFGGLINAVANMAINKLSTYLQNQIGQLFGGAGGIVGQAVGAVTGGVGAGVGAAVPVNTISINENVYKIDTQTKKTQDATETAAQKDCVGDPLVARLKNALLSMLMKSIIDFANGGFNGDSAIIGNLTQFAKTAVDALVQDFIQNATAGICAKDRGSTQVLLLQQYQYEESYAVRSQCTDESAAQKEDGDSELLYNRIFQDQNTQYGAYIHAQSELRAEKAAANLKSVVTYIAGDGVQPKIDCTEGGGTPKGIYCEGGLGKGHVTLTGDQAGHIIKKAITLPIDQALSADEIGELIDAFAAGLTQFIFQGIDGLAGASKRSGNQGSYLDQMVSQSTYDATNGTQQVVGGDIEAAAATEEEYLATVTAALARVTAIRTAYRDAIACYQTKLTTSQNQFAQERITNASTTIATILNPQITELTKLKGESEAALLEYDDLLEAIRVAETQDDVLLVHNDFTNLLAIGRVHTRADLVALETNLSAANASLNLLATDAATQLTECRAL